MVKKYRKKPVVVEAIIWDGFDVSEVFDFVTVRWTKKAHVLQIATLEGYVNASPGDYIIKGIANEFYPCKPGIFEATYDKVEEEVDW